MESKMKLSEVIKALEEGKTVVSTGSLRYFLKLHEIEGDRVIVRWWENSSEPKTFSTNLWLELNEKYMILES